jgi:hypothetical protein
MDFFGIAALIRHMGTYSPFIMCTVNQLERIYASYCHAPQSILDLTLPVILPCNAPYYATKEHGTISIRQAPISSHYWFRWDVTCVSRAAIMLVCAHLSACLTANFGLSRTAEPHRSYHGGMGNKPAEVTSIQPQ